MRRTALFATLLLLSAASAERVARPVRMTPTEVFVSDGRLVALTGNGFAVLDGAKIVARDASGKHPRELFELKSPPDGWWIDRSGTRLAWNTGGRLHRRGPAGTSEVGAAAGTGVAFSPDGTRAAAICDGQLVVFSTDDDALVSLPPGERHAWHGLPAWTLDGGSVLVAHGLPGRPTDLHRIEAGKTLTERGVVYSSKSGSLGALAVSTDCAVLFDSDRVMRIPLDGGDAEEIARGEVLGELARTPEGTEAVFTGRAANGRRSAFTVGLTRQGTRRGYMVDLLAFAEEGDVTSPAPAAGGFCWILIEAGDRGKRVVLTGNRR
ncbi:MAG: hypothetical protein HUU15_05775 [Candidatus Brocadiae bacterium]|nr:hypothetical protein [Candidatus Brocadiia bacterium]